jgi:hypothetical protein
MCLLTFKEVLTMLKTPKKDLSKELSKAEGDAKKQRKKLAKREAELMLKVDQAKKDLHKAEQKLTRARAGVETAQSTLQTIELELAELRTPAQETAPATDDSEQSTPPVVQDENSNGDPGEPPDAEQAAGVPPVEGRVDVPELSEPSEPSGENSTSESGGRATGVRISSYDVVFADWDGRQNTQPVIQEKDADCDNLPDTEQVADAPSAKGRVDVAEPSGKDGVSDAGGLVADSTEEDSA